MVYVRDHSAYAYSYTYDFYSALVDFHEYKFLTHFWSLAVEEQCYMVWPFVIYATPRAHLRRLMVVIVLLGPVIRVLSMFFLGGLPLQATVSLYVLPTTHLDAFALGALAALSPIRISARQVVGVILFAVAAGFFASSRGRLVTIYEIGMPDHLQWVWGYTVVNLVGVVVLLAATQRLPLVRVLENGALRYLGRISYGFYILHYPVQGALELLAPSLPLLASVVIQLVVTTGLAALSFHFVELPINGRKDSFFPSPTHAPAKLATACATVLGGRGSSGKAGCRPLPDN